MLKSFFVLFICVGFSVAKASNEEEYSKFKWYTTPDYTDFNHSSSFPECGQNEVWDCVYSCPPQKTCRTREDNIECADFVDYCDFQCACEEGFFRNVIGGECISAQQCDKCPGSNEHYACGGPCDNICHSLHLQNKTSCPHNYTDCQPSCYCDEEYARDDDGICIPIENCRKENII